MLALVLYVEMLLPSSAELTYMKLPITFDWTIITAFVGSPLPYPFFAIVNTLIGVVVFFLFAGLGLKYTGGWYQDYLPISSVSPALHPRLNTY